MCGFWFLLRDPAMLSASALSLDSIILWYIRLADCARITNTISYPNNSPRCIVSPEFLSQNKFSFCFYYVVVFLNGDKKNGFILSTESLYVPGQHTI